MTERDLRTVKPYLGARRMAWRAAWSLLLLASLCTGWPARVQAAEREAQATVLSAVGKVEFLSEGSRTWYVAASNLVLYSGDQIRTGERSRALLRLRDGSLLPMKQLSTIRLMERPRSVLVELLRGMISFLHRDEPGSLEFQGGGINAAVRGTEVAFALRDDGAVAITLFDGEVEVSDEGPVSRDAPDR